MIENRVEIINGILQGLNDSQISRKYHHGRNLIRQIRSQIESGDLTIFNLNNKIGRPKKRTPELETEVINITFANRRMGIHQLADIISQNPNLPSVSPRTISSIRHDFGFNFLPTRVEFPLNDEQKQKRVNFAQHHLANGTDWSKILYTDKSMFILGDSGRWLWRRKGETDPAIFRKTTKFPQKVMIFGGFAKGYRTPLIAIEGTINAEVYIDECLDGTNCIFDMDAIYGKRLYKKLRIFENFKI